MYMTFAVTEKLFCQLSSMALSVCIILISSWPFQVHVSKHIRIKEFCCSWINILITLRICVFQNDIVVWEILAMFHDKHLFAG